MKKQTILIVDDETDFLEWAVKHLANDVVEVKTTSNVEDAHQLFLAETLDLVISELHLSPFSGMELLKKIRTTDPNAMVILTTGFPPSNAVIEAMRIGAYDFLRKESLPYDLRPVVESALRSRDEMRATPVIETPVLKFDQSKQSIIGKSKPMQEVFKMIGRASRADAPVMVTGESGCGKELVARAIHKFSPRATKDFVAINCAAIPEQLLESELFGHEKGSFTGATSQRVGRFEQCDGGTLFLDEIGDMPLQVQSKILRVLQEGEFSRVGGNQTLKTDVRILAATNKDLESEVGTSKFREDLFYRLNVVRIHIPPLRQRPEDVRLLADHFLQKIAHEKGLRHLRLSGEAYAQLEGHGWPGNVRELENTIQRASVMGTSEVLLPADIPLGHASAPAAAGSDEPTTSPALTSAADALRVLFEAAENDPDLQLLPWVEREMTLFAMARTGNNQVQAAKLLGITRATLRKRVERFASDQSEEAS